MPKMTALDHPRKNRTEKAQTYRRLTLELLHNANLGSSRHDFMQEVVRLLMEYTRCEALENWAKDGNRIYRMCSARVPVIEEQYEAFECPQPPADSRIPLPSPSVQEGPVEPWFKAILCKKSDADFPAEMLEPSFWDGRPGLSSVYRSYVLAGFLIDEHNSGLIFFKHRKAGFFTPDKARVLQGLVQMLGAATAYRRAQYALRERVKELSCLYQISMLAEDAALPADRLLDAIARLLPQAWQYPEAAQARIRLDGQDYTSAEEIQFIRFQAAEIWAAGEDRGRVEVGYRVEEPEEDEGPFLKEERNLIDAVARQLSLILERRKAEMDARRLQEQLRHADRLATIGTLAAGVAHELNEPLSTILGFGQLIQKGEGLHGQAKSDLEKILAASLHAREIVRKLMIFARQEPPRMVLVDLNAVVEESLYLFEGQCGKSGIDLHRELMPALPLITADPSQLRQVLINLAVNAVQAMTRGGTLLLQTFQRPRSVVLAVEDTGSGMPEEMLRHIFLPFYTTKDVGQGTGLGLAVVHGIVTSHGGIVHVQSRPGKGSRFEVELPVHGDETYSEEIHARQE